MNCHEVITNQYNSAGTPLKEWKCYCGTTGCLKGRIQNYDSVETVKYIKKTDDCDCLMEWQLADPNNPCEKCQERESNWYKKMFKSKF